MTLSGPLSQTVALLGLVAACLAADLPEDVWCRAKTAATPTAVPAAPPAARTESSERRLMNTGVECRSPMRGLLISTHLGFRESALPRISR